MQEVDLERVKDIWLQESIRVHNWMENPNSFWKKKLPDFQDVIEHSDTKLVYEEDSIIKGFIVKYKNNYIPELFVDHNYRTYLDGQSKKIGRILIDYLKLSNPSLTTSVYILNYNAIKFYIKNDFIITKFYAENETGFAKLLMEWKK